MCVAAHCNTLADDSYYLLRKKKTGNFTEFEPQLGFRGTIPFYQREINPFYDPLLGRRDEIFAALIANKKPKLPTSPSKSPTANKTLVRLKIGVLKLLLSQKDTALSVNEIIDSLPPRLTALVDDQHYLPSKFASLLTSLGKLGLVTYTKSDPKLKIPAKWKINLPRHLADKA